MPATKAMPIDLTMMPKVWETPDLDAMSVSSPMVSRSTGISASRMAADTTSPSAMAYSARYCRSSTASATALKARPAICNMFIAISQRWS